MPNNFLSSGVYGCVYHPPYDCQGNPKSNKHYVSKLVKADFTSKTETKVGELLKEYMSKQVDIKKSKELEELIIKSGFVTAIKSCNIDFHFWDSNNYTYFVNDQTFKYDCKYETRKDIEHTFPNKHSVN